MRMTTDQDTLIIAALPAFWVDEGGGEVDDEREDQVDDQRRQKQGHRGGAGPFLTMIGAFLVPVFAILIVDCYIIKRRTYTRDILSDAGGIYVYSRAVFLGCRGCEGHRCPRVLSADLRLSQPRRRDNPVILASFVLYLGLSWRSRPRFAEVARGHLSDSVG